MAILDPPTLRPCDDLDDVDDYRPRSKWATAVDPATLDREYLRDAAVTIDEVAPGDSVPLHVHPTYEVVYLAEGPAEITVGDDTRIVEAGAIVFAPAGVPHGGRAIDGPARFVGFFPTDVIETTYLERNPAPGTEGDPPRPVVVFDVRAEG